MPASAWRATVFDYRLVDRLVLPMLGKGGDYRSFDKVLEIPRGIFADFADWSKLALMRNRRTLEELERLRRSAVEPQAIARMIAVIENELGFALYDAVGRLKRALSGEDRAEFRFSGAGLEIAAEVTRADFEAWIADDIARIAATVDRAMMAAGAEDGAIDRVFLTGRHLAGSRGAIDLHPSLRRGEDRGRRRADLHRPWPGADRGGGRPLRLDGLRASQPRSATIDLEPVIPAARRDPAALSAAREERNPGSGPASSSAI